MSSLPHVVQIDDLENDINANILDMKLYKMETKLKPSQVLSVARAAFNSGQTRSYEFRIEQLKKLKELCKNHDQELNEALKKDLNKSKFESQVCEIGIIKSEIDYFLDNLKSWMSPQKADMNLLTLTDTVYMKKDPRGVVLIIGPWNYPLQLILNPLIGALAGGNCVIMKPSEIAPETASILAQLIPKYLNKECYHVVLGGVDVSTELLKEKFDYIFYTGSTNVGKSVRAAANEHLTPVTLELGGKSPVYIDNTANIPITTRRIIWGKCINAGQTCIAPDYILCSKNIQAQFIEEAKIALKEWYGDDPSLSPDFCRIINDKHFSRLTALLKNADVAIGGKYNAADRFISPTILVNVKDTDPIMNEEIFGPILPIINIKSVDEAIKFILNREHPLSLYIFSADTNVQNLIMDSTTSGSVCVNDTLTQFAVNTLPFGGIGDSGMGAYHGKFSFDTFTHNKSCLIKNFNPLIESVTKRRYPPYTENNLSLLKLAMAHHRGLNIGFKHILYFIIGALVGGFLMYLLQMKSSKTE